MNNEAKGELLLNKYRILYCTDQVLITVLIAPPTWKEKSNMFDKIKINKSRMANCKSVPAGASQF